MEIVNTVGRRKAAVARVFVKPGKGQITINRKALETYFPLDILQFQVKQPLLATNTVENYDIVINLDGGGIKGQAEAARLGIARALCEPDSSPATRVRLSVRSRDSRAHVASSSSVSVNPYRTDFRHARRGFQIRKTTYYYMSTCRLPRRGKLRGLACATTGELIQRELKLKKTN